MSSLSTIPINRLNNAELTEEINTVVDNSENVVTVDYIKNIFSTLYPVGSLYIGTQTACPLANLIEGSTWELVSVGRALWGGNGTNANTTIEAGLPNITGQSNGFESESSIGSSSGAIKTISTSNGWSGGVQHPYKYIQFNASWSNSIYSNSNTVQPPAYVVNVWKRIA